jgi:hypothetical protein
MFTTLMTLTAMFMLVFLTQHYILEEIQDTPSEPKPPKKIAD